jgi:hypothetical protein
MHAKKAKGKKEFRFWHNQKKEKREWRRGIQINFHPENCFEIVENLFIFVRFFELLYDEKISNI